MYDLRQFLPSLYVLVYLGISGFALAAESAGVWVLSTIAIGFNAWLMRSGRLRPLPRIIANTVTVLGLLFIIMQIRYSGATPILTIGNFLVFLQVIKLYEQRANRDHAQLLVLSLLLMVAAAINTASLIFGVLFIIYLFLSLYCCLLFHLKVETDHARANVAVPEDDPNPASLRQDQRFLSRSMRRLTWLVSAVAVSMSVLVFLFFPRGAGAGILGPMQFHPAETLTGFREEVKFQQIAKITQNTDAIAHVRLTHNNKIVRGSAPLLLRGITLDRYSGKDPQIGPAFQWARTPVPANEQRFESPNGSDKFMLTDEPPSPGADLWQQDITLLPTGTNVLFAMAGAVSIRPEHVDLGITYSEHDQVLQAASAPNSQIEYVVESTGQVGVRLSLSDRVRQIRRILLEQQQRDFGSAIDPKIAEYARRSDVSGTNSAGRSLATVRGSHFGPSPLDAQICENIQRHLQSTFTYTLDLTDAARVPRDQDPLVSFLYDFKRGHCEYFAGAMTAMCQSLHMNARMVVGFRCDDYNPMSDVYIVRQSHAHAWVEVEMPDGTWQTYDPTSSREADYIPNPSAWQKVRHVFDYLEYNWANYVVAYDRDSRDNLVQNVENTMNRTTVSSTDVMARFNEWVQNGGVLLFSSRLIAALVGMLIAGIVGLIAFFFYDRWRLRRRARRIGLAGLSDSDQLRLARQLGFYDDLIKLLERHQITRPAQLTPLEFATSLAYLPNEAYSLITRLTLLFYRIRYGHTEVPPTQQRRLDTIVSRLSTTLSPQRPI